MLGDFEYVYVVDQRDVARRARDALEAAHGLEVLVDGQGSTWQLRVRGQLPPRSYEAFTAAESEEARVAAVRRVLDDEGLEIDQVAVLVGGELEARSWSVGH